MRRDSSCSEVARMSVVPHILIFVFVLMAFGLAACANSSPPAGPSLRGAVLVTAGPSADPVEKKAVQMFVEEVQKRTGLTLQEAPGAPADQTPVIVVATRARLPAFAQQLGALPGEDQAAAVDGYVLRVDTQARPAPTVLAIGNDPRGTVFAVGRLLRALYMSSGRLEVEVPLDLVEKPMYAIRGHQLGYRPKANSYDKWDVARYEQYIRDLIVFGTSAVELLSPFDPDDSASSNANMPVPPEQMESELSRVLASYGLDVWLWLPVRRRDVVDPERRRAGLEARREVFRRYVKIDHLIIPAGDPGDTPPQELMPYLQELAVVLRQVHPKAGIWLTNQGMEVDELPWFYTYIQTERPAWLTGVCYGPWARDTIEHTRAAVPSQYPLRDYPDVTHTVRCQYPVPQWDQAFALTLNREPINPRPMGEAHIHNVTAPHTVGAITYSDGCNDDVNKMIWSLTGWNPEADIRQALIEYGRYFVGPDFAVGVADGLLALENNWKGSLLANEGVDQTLAHWRAMEQRAPASVLANWRLQQGLFRAYYDAYIRKRLIYETELEKQARQALRQDRQKGANAAMEEARAILARADTQKVAPELRARIEQLAGDLYDSIGMQLSVPKYAASGEERGAVLDTMDSWLNDRQWLNSEFDRLKQAPSDAAKLAGIDRVLNWEDPGPGGFYDDLGYGAAGKQPHLVLAPGWETDPGFVLSAQDEHGGPREGRLAWRQQAQALYDAPLRLHYEGLDPNATYKMRLVYAGRFNAVMRLVADGKYEIHAAVGPQSPIAPQEFPIPKAASADGKLDLAWTRVSGRGPQVAEIWLLKQ